MSLTQDDLEQIGALLDRKLEPIRGELEALRNDVQEIYDMLTELQKNSVTIVDKTFRKLPVKEQILQLNAAVVALAKQENITLPR